MPQTRDTGAQANTWGLDTARRIMAALDAQPVSDRSNECLWNGRRVVIKTANLGVTSVGVSYKMLDHLQSVVAAFRQDDSTFELYELDRQRYADNMTPTRSKGPSKGRVGIVRRSVFVENGKALGTTTLK